MEKKAGEIMQSLLPLENPPSFAGSSHFSKLGWESGREFSQIFFLNFFIFVVNFVIH